MYKMGEIEKKDSNVEAWLNQVSLSKSGSKNTEVSYRNAFTRFLARTGKTSEQILTDYETLPEKTFKRRYAQAIMNFIMEEKNRGVSSNSYAKTLYAIKSFFKYNSLPLNFIASPNVMVENHNRDIDREEIAEIVKASDYREKAFYLLMAQSGLRPSTLTKLKMENIEKILDEETPVPCLINVPQESTKGKYDDYFTFCGQESVNALKDYFQTRSNLKPESLVFVKAGQEEEVSAGDFTHFFRRTVMRLAKKNILEVKTSKKDLTVESAAGEELRSFTSRNDLRLYNLRKFFRKYAGQAGVDYCNFWMGHLSSMGVDLHYFSRDVEMHRAVYKEKAMPFLRVETKTPSETEKQIELLSAENKALKDELSGVKSKLEQLESTSLQVGSKAALESIMKRLRELEKKLGESEQPKTEGP